MVKILRCVKCYKYTFKEKCKCNSPCITVRPPKYSVKDKYSRLRRLVKYELGH